jgi:DNA-binding CsgD family transcriptional regulator
MCDYVVLPLLNSSFEPGRAREVVEGFVDVDLRNIARAELFYFTGQAEECCEITRGYLSSRVIELKLSACILYGYSNLSLGNVTAALLHLPTDGMPAFGEYSRMLPEGLRLFATYVMAHHTYLNGEIWSAYGMGKAALFMAERSYPISMTYIHCMMAVCAINRKHKQEAQEEMLRSWELAKMDGFLEPFIEHHGLLRGLIEACIRNRDPEAYQRITEGVISFSRGWMALHNPENRRKVTGELSTMEFSIAMLASGGWTNKEIGEHLGISINTVKHYLTDIFCKLNVKKRDELKKFMLK